METQVLLSKYGSNPQQRGMVCYRDFCAAIDASKWLHVVCTPLTCFQQLAHSQRETRVLEPRG